MAMDNTDNGKGNDKGEDEDGEEAQEMQEATQKLAALMKEHDIEVDYAEADWKDTQGLIEEAHDLIIKHPGWDLTYVNGDEFGIDDNFVFFTSKPVDDDVVIEIGRLIVDEGAELPDEEKAKRPVCPKCGREIDCLVSSLPAAVPIVIALHDSELDWYYQDGLEMSDIVTDFPPDDWFCPECNEQLFMNDPVIIKAFLGGG